MSTSPTKDDLKSLFRKRLIICCDGTGQSSSTGHQVIPTNVARLVNALETSNIRRDVASKLNNKDGVEEVPQIVLYQPGVGADGVTKISKTLAQAFGIGVDGHIIEAYFFLANNYERGDEVFLFGFSRGAFTARAIAALICNVGLLKKKHLVHLPAIYKKYKQRRDDPDSREEFKNWMIHQGYHLEMHANVVITLMGVWDTVSSLGLPETWVSKKLGITKIRDYYNAKYGYHDTSLPSPRTPEKGDEWRGYVRRAYQALSLEENRTSFSPILFRFPREESPDVPENGPAFVQCWFPGVHTDVGGGYERAYRDISDLSFAWMIDMCWPYLSFKNTKIKESFKHPSTIEVDPTELSWFGWLAWKLGPPPKKPEETPWGLSDAHDELHTLAFWAGGSTHRKPKQYFLGQTHDSNKKEFLTHEYMHASVRMRRMVDKHGKPSTWRPKALEGFELKWHEGTGQGEDQSHWYWAKEVWVGGEKQEVIIKEWMPDPKACRTRTQEYALLQTSEEQLKLLQTREACMKIEMVSRGWSKKWLWLLLGLPGLAAAAVGVKFDSRKSHLE